MVYLLDAYFGRDGREESEALLAAALGRPRQAAHPRRLQRADARLAVVLHVLLLHRPRRQVPARQPRRERLRPALAHLPLHAHRGGPPHVRGRDGRRADRAAHLRADARAQDGRRASASAASTSPPSSGTSTSTARCRSTCSAPRCRPTPPTSTRWASRAASRRRRRRTTICSRTATYPVRGAGRATAIAVPRGAGARLAERAAARRLRRRLRSAASRAGTRSSSSTGSTSSCRLPHRGFHRAIGSFARGEGVAGRPRHQRGRVGRPAPRVAADRGRPGLRRQASCSR